MESAEMSLMPVILAKFNPRLGIDDYQCVGLNDRSCLLLLLRGDGDLFVRAIVPGEMVATKKLLGKVRRFSWEEGQTCHVIARFSVLSNDRSLSLYEINSQDLLLTDASEEGGQLQSLKQIQKATTKDMKSLLKRKQIECFFKTVDLVGRCQSGCALLVDGHVLVVVSQSEACSVIKSVVHLDQSTLFASPLIKRDPTVTPVAMSFVGNLVFSLSSSGVVIIYHLEKSKLLAILDAKFYATEIEGMQFQEEEIFCHLAVSPTALLVVTSTSCNQLCLVYLHKYYDKFPGHFQSSFLAVATCNIEPDFSGDEDWEEEEEEQQSNFQFVGDIWFRRTVKHMQNSLSAFQSSDSIINVAGTGLRQNVLFQSKSGRLVELGDKMVNHFMDGLHRSAQTRPLSLQISDDNHDDETMDTKSIFSSLCSSVMAACPSDKSSSEQAQMSSQEETLYETSDWDRFPDLLSGLCVKWIHLDVTTLSVIVAPTSRRVSSLLQESEKEYGFVWSLNIQTPHKPPAKYNFQEGVTVAVMTRSESPVCLLTDSCAFTCVQDVSQEALVNKLLLFDNARLAERLCRLNCWERYSLPLNALERAVRHRQLDTIAFFLHSGGVSQDGDKEQSRAARIFKYFPQLPPLAADQMEAAIQLLIGSVEENYGKRRKSQFAEQLLNLTLNFLQRLMEDQTTETAEKKQDSMSATMSPEDHSIRESRIESTSVSEEGMLLSGKIPLGILASYVTRLRHLVKRPSATPHTKSPLRSTSTADARYEAISSSWHKMDTESVIKVAIQNNELPLVQVFLNRERSTTAIASKLGASGTDAELTSAIVRQISMRKAGGQETDEHILNSSLLSSLVRVGTKLVLQSLLNKNMAFAQKLLTNMGCNVAAELQRVCFATVHKPLRDVLALELMQNGWLTSAENDTVNYAQIVERLYGIQNYDEVLLSDPPDELDSDVSPPSWYKCGTVKPFCSFHLKIPKSYTPPSNQSSTGFVQLSLDWVSSWDAETRERILLDKVHLSPDDAEEIGQLVSASSRWNYYFAHNDWKALVQWIQQALPSLEPHSVSAGQIVAALVGVNEQQSWCHIPPHLWATLPHSTHFASEMVLDELAKRGQFCDEELSSFPKLLRRISRVHNLFGHVHPLSSLYRSESSPSSKDMILCPQDFHKRFLAHCVKNRFVNIMYEYMDHYRLGCTPQDINALGLDGEQKDWVHVLVRFRLAAVHGREAIFSASLANSQLVLQPVIRPRPVIACVQDMLEHGRTLMAMATLMYAPVSIEEAMSRRGEPWSVDAAKLQKALSAYPKLQAAVFADQSKANKTAAELQDVSLYELLQSSESCDVSCLFRWQSTNNLITDKDNVMQEMPHFSHPVLVSQYAYKERLPFTYYLLKGRPSFAFVTFVSHHNAYSKTGPKRIKAGYDKAYQMALRHFHNPSVSAGCVAFVEMLGEDSTMMRVDIECATRLYEHCCEETLKVQSLDTDLKPDSLLYNNKEEIVHELLAACALNVSAMKVVKRLEYATKQAVSKLRLQKTSTAAVDLWRLVLRYCQMRDLPLCTGFLVECALNQSWLTFICHAEENHIPADKVLEVIDREFSNPHLREHLQLAFKSVLKSGNTPRKPWPQTLQEQRQAKREQRLQRERKMKREVASRNQRTRLYTRIGVSQATKQVTSVKDVVRTEESRDMDEVKEKLEGEVNDVETISELPILIAQDLPGNLFDVLLFCQTYEQPWRAMLAHSFALERNLLAILAGCQQDAEMLDCICVWLCVTCGSEVLGPALTNIKGSIQWHCWSLDDLRSLLLVATEHQPTVAKAMSLALEYFDPNNLLLEFLHFHEAVTIQLDFPIALQHLRNLNEGLDKCDAGDKYPGKVGNRDWMEQLCAHMADIILLKCPDWMLSRFLCVMSEGMFGESFNCIVTDYAKLYTIFTILEKADIDPTICLTQKHEGDGEGGSGVPHSPDSWLVRNHPIVLQALLDQHRFDAAREYADALGLASDAITEKEVLYDLETFQSSDLWKTSQGRATFWQRCHNAFTANKCNPEAAGHFFEALLDHSCTAEISQRERAVILEYALHWYNKGLSSQNNNGRAKLEKDMWLCRIRAAMELQKKSGSVTDAGRDWLAMEEESQTAVPGLKSVTPNLSDLLARDKAIASALSSSAVDQWVQMVHKEDLNPVLETYDEQNALETVIGQVLDDQDIIGACRLSALFCQSTDDLDVVVSCLRLANEQIKFDELSPRLCLQIKDMKQDVTETVSGLVSPLSAEPHWDQGYGDPDSEQMANYLDILTGLCDCGKKICLRVAISFKMALVLKTSFESVLAKPPFDVLLQLLSSNMVHKYTQAEKFIAACVLSPMEVADFLSKGILKALQVQFGEGVLSPGKPGFIFDPSSPPEEFHRLARLCSNPSLVGNKLLEHAIAFARDTELSISSLSVEVELMILSHDCHTMSCSMEGIASVLRLARQRTPYLAKAKQFKLMVHLLVGIGRYREMYFVLDSLRKHDQFEILLQSGSNKHEKLKRSLLEYLWRPQDKALREMVALHLTMYRAVAEMHKLEADKQLLALKSIKLGKLLCSQPHNQFC
jgi:spatacsin